jgi:hypothetical protein
LSRYLPTDTWPQARANLGERDIRRVAVTIKRYLRSSSNFLVSKNA